MEGNYLVTCLSRARQKMRAGWDSIRRPLAYLWHVFDDAGPVGTRLLYASDLHGSTLCFKKLLKAAVDLRVNALVIGGDLSGKFLVPIARVEHETWRAEIAGKIETVQGADALHKALERIENSGDYGVVVSDAEASTLRSEVAAYEASLRTKVKERLKDWLATAEETLRPSGIRLLLICGNDDEWQLEDVIRGFPFAENLDIAPNPVVLGPHEFIGESAANETPFHCPRDMEEGKLLARLDVKARKVTRARSAVFVIHVPPIGIGLDSCVEIDPHTHAPRMYMGMPAMANGGSTTVKDVIARYQPLLSLHGHIHESPGVTTIGRTTCCNAGSDYAKGMLRAMLVLLDADEVRATIAISR